MRVQAPTARLPSAMQSTKTATTVAKVKSDAPRAWLPRRISAVCTVIIAKPSRQATAARRRGAAAPTRGPVPAPRSPARAGQRDVAEPRGEVDEAHQPQGADHAEGRQQPVAGGERADEGAERVQAVHGRVDARRVGDAARERLRQQRDRRAHQRCARHHERGREQRVVREAEGRLVGTVQRERARDREEQLEGDRVRADRRLHDAVAAQQLARARTAAAARDAPRVGAEERVAERQAAEKEGQHAGRRLRVRAEQGREHALPGHLVDESGGARGDGEQQGERARHGRALYPNERIGGAPRIYSPAMRAPGRVLVHALFFASGATALVYQVVWVRSLSLILGASHLAVSIVLAAFMGGLALGAVAIGRRVAGHAQPLRIYAWLELGIAVCALVLPLLLRGVQFVYVSLALALEDRSGGAAAAAGVRAVLAFAALVLPTFLMGGTLPVLVAAVVRRHADLHARLASLYAINTAGAAAGALAGGFLLLPTLGVRRSELVAAAGNLAIGVTALYWARLRARAAAEPPQTPAEPARGEPLAGAGSDAFVLRLVFASTAVCGFGALALEVLWTRAISVVIGSNVYSFTVMLVAFLCGIALGSAIHGALPRRLTEGAHFALLAAAIAASTLAVSFAIPRLPELVAWQKPMEAGAGFDPWTALWLCFLVMLVPCVLHGMAFPLAGEARARLERRPARSVGELVGLNTAGSIAGSLCAGFVLIPWIGMQRSLLGISALYASASIAVAAAVLTRRGVRRPLVAAGALAAIACAWAGVLALRPWDTRLIGAFRNSESVDLVRARQGLDEGGFADSTVLYYREGRGSTVSVVEDSAGVRRLQIDGKVVASDAASDVRHELLLGHLPVLAHPAPRSALVVGLGATVTLGAVAAHPELESITVVEIESAVGPASPFFAHLQGDPLEDPRVRLVVQDGRNYLLATSRRFDVITADPIHPWVRGSGYLYTREYYELARAHLTEGGVMCQWLPLYQLGPEDLRAAVGSFVDVFPDATLWSTPADAVLIGTTRPLRIDLPDWQRRLQATSVHDGLARVGLADLLSLIAEFTLGPDGMRRFAADARRNTDDNVFLEFSSPRRMGGGQALMASNARLLASLAESPAGLLGEVSPPFASRAEAERALAQVLAAKVALADVLAADLPLPLRIARLREIAKGPPPYGPAQDELAWQLRLVGRQAFAAGDDAQAERAFELASRLAPFDWRAKVERAWVLRRRGERDAAIASLREALRLAPHVPPAHYELAGVLLENGEREEALVHLRAAAAARPSWAEPRNDLAWLLVTDPSADAEARREGLALAESAAALSNSRDPEILDTLAVAYAANGRAERARAVADEALALARAEKPGLVSTLEARSAALARGDLTIAPDGAEAASSRRSARAIASARRAGCRASRRADPPARARGRAAAAPRASRGSRGARGSRRGSSARRSRSRGAGSGRARRRSGRARRRRARRGWRTSPRR